MVDFFIGAAVVIGIGVLILGLCLLGLVIVNEIADQIREIFFGR